jgi:hypothetical protein
MQNDLNPVMAILLLWSSNKFFFYQKSNMADIAAQYFNMCLYGTNIFKFFFSETDKLL